MEESYALSLREIINIFFMKKFFFPFEWKYKENIKWTKP